MRPLWDWPQEVEWSVLPNGSFVYWLFNGACCALPDMWHLEQMCDAAQLGELFLGVVLGCVGRSLHVQPFWLLVASLVRCTAMPLKQVPYYQYTGAHFADLRRMPG